MADEPPLKSSYELALERLRALDREEGVSESVALTTEQKAEIARLRREAQAKLAELEILRKKNLAELGPEPEKRQELEEHYAIDRRRAESALESAIARVKKS